MRAGEGAAVCRLLAFIPKMTEVTLNPRAYAALIVSSPRDCFPFPTRRTDDSASSWELPGEFISRLAASTREGESLDDVIIRLAPHVP